MLCVVLTGSKKTKKSKKPDDSIAQWTEENRVQLLSIAEKAGVEDPSKSNPEAKETDQTDGGTSVAAAPQMDEPAPAEDDTETKGDDKRVVTVATFGFPKVSIQPPSKAEGEGEDNEAGAKETEAKESQEVGKEEGTSKSEPIQVCSFSFSGYNYVN